MRKKLDTRFPAVRIKKIMQADEDVGKIAMAVPVLVSKALELFLQDLCDRTYGITVQRGAKTVNSLHLKHCVHSYNVFDFLKEVVSKVPDYGHSGHSDTASDVSKKRKVVANESNDSDEESKRNSMQETCHVSSSGRGRGRVRGRGRGRASRATERELLVPHREVEPIGSTTIHQGIKQVPSPMDNNNNNSSELKEENKDIDGAVGAVGGSESRNFDLNAGGDENSKKTASTAAVFASSADVKGDEYHPPVLSEMDRMAIDPLHLAQVGSRLDEDDEDYDEEG